MPYWRLLSLVIASRIPWYDLDSIEDSTRTRDATLILQSSCRHDGNSAASLVWCNVTVQSVLCTGSTTITSQRLVSLQPCGGADNLLLLQDLPPDQAHIMVSLLDCFVHQEAYQQKKVVPVSPHPSAFFLELSETFIERQVTFDLNQLRRRALDQSTLKSLHYSDFLRMLETLTEQESRYVGFVVNSFGAIFLLLVTIYAWIALSFQKKQIQPASETTFRTALSTLASHHTTNSGKHKSIDSDSTLQTSCLLENDDDGPTLCLEIPPIPVQCIDTKIEQREENHHEQEHSQETFTTHSLFSPATKVPLQDTGCISSVDDCHDDLSYDSSDLQCDVVSAARFEGVSLVTPTSGDSSDPRRDDHTKDVLSTTSSSIESLQASISEDEYHFLLRSNVFENPKLKGIRAPLEDDDSSATSESSTAQHNVVHNTDSCIIHREPSSSNEPKRLIMLLSNGVCDRFQSKHQHRAIMLLETKGTPFVTIDAMDLTQRIRRKELLLLSGMGTNYPQFFFEQRDGTTTFIGDWETLQDINDASSIPDDIRKAHPTIQTWDQVFNNIVISFH